MFPSLLTAAVIYLAIKDQVTSEHSPHFPILEVSVLQVIYPSPYELLCPSKVNICGPGYHSATFPVFLHHLWQQMAKESLFGWRAFATRHNCCRQRAGWCAVGQAQSERMELEHVHKIISTVTKHLTTTRGSRVEHFKRECSLIHFIKHELASFHLCTQPITDTIFSSSQNLCVENIDNAEMMQLQMHTSLTYSQLAWTESLFR